jgi:phage shock protein PspC (stress-responsive transcriptional regulator)
MSESRLTRSQSDKVIAGVCGGLAVYLNVDSTLVRLALVLLVLASGIGVPLYIVLAIIMPSEASDAASNASLGANATQFANDVEATLHKATGNTSGPVILAGILILAGLYLLINNMGWIGHISGEYFWPLALVALGIYLVVRRSR